MTPTVTLAGRTVSVDAPCYVIAEIGVKRPCDAEADVRRVARKSQVWRRDLPSGHVIAAEDLTAKRPGTELPPDRMKMVEGSTLTRAVRRAPRRHIRSLRCPLSPASPTRLPVLHRSVSSEPDGRECALGWVFIAAWVAGSLWLTLAGGLFRTDLPSRFYIAMTSVALLGSGFTNAMLFGADRAVQVMLVLALIWRVRLMARLRQDLQLKQAQAKRALA